MYGHLFNFVNRNYLKASLQPDQAVHIVIVNRSLSVPDWNLNLKPFSLETVL